MDMIQSLVQRFYGSLQCFSFGDDVPDAVGTDAELMDRIAGLVIELDADDIRIAGILVCLGKDVPVSLAHEEHAGVGNAFA